MKLLICFILALASLKRWHSDAPIRDEGIAGIPYLEPAFALKETAPGLRREAWTRQSASGSINWCVSCERDAQGHTRRPPSLRRAFQRANPCPSTGLETGACPGFQARHIQPLTDRGANSLENMEWQATGISKSRFGVATTYRSSVSDGGGQQHRTVIEPSPRHARSHSPIGRSPEGVPA